MISTSKVAQLTLAALAGAAIAGGGIALASGTSNTIHGCVTRSTHQLLIQKRCTRAQTTLTFNRQGPAGKQGPIGPAGPQAVGAWALIADNGTSAGITTGENLAVSRVGVGADSVSLTGGPCTTQGVAAVVANAETGSASLSGAIPFAYVTRTPGALPFTVTAGYLQAGSFTATDGLNVDVAVYCKTS
jgi:hypothetical protein